MYKVLVIENDIRETNSLRESLGSEYIVVGADSRQDAIVKGLQLKIDLILLDHQSKVGSGAEFCAFMRSTNEFKCTPVIFVSAEASLEVKKRAFESGAQDFIVKPFLAEELRMRVKAAIQNYRALRENQQQIVVGNMVISPRNRTVTINGREIKLTAREYSVLFYLVENKNKVISANDVLANVWGDLLVTQGNLYTQMYNLKTKLREFNGELATINRVGFRLMEAPHLSGAEL